MWFSSLPFRVLLIGFLSCLHCLMTEPALGEGNGNLPNILVIVADDQGWNDIGYHCEEMRTPNLDRLANEGVKLESHYVMPQCTPTRVSLITGRYPSRFGAHCTTASNEPAYPLGTLTMASMLKSKGYDTAITGKWHMGSTVEHGPNHFGFDYSYGGLAGAVGMYDHRYRLDTPYAQTWHRNLEFIEEEGHVTDLTAAEAIKFIGKERDRPFFLYLPFNAVHTPLVEEERWVDANSHIQHPDRRLFAASATHLDDAIGRVYEALERTGQVENTLIVFTSDNGAVARDYSGGNYPPPDPALEALFSSNDPLRGKKTETYEGGIRVPAFVSWKGHLQPREMHSPIHAVDWMPTIATLVGYEPEGETGWDGRSNWKELESGGEINEERSLYWLWGMGRNNERVALRHGDWKIVRMGADAGWELFNLGEDPNETTDLAEKNSEKLKELLGYLKEEQSKDRRQG